MQTLNAWGQILQQESHAPNVLPAQFQTFATNAAAPVLAALTSVSCTPSIDATTQYYGAATLKVAIAAAGATLSFAGTPIAIAQGSRWFAAFSILAPSGCTGSLTVKTANTTLTEDFTVPSATGWQQVWGLFDLRADASTQATWELTFSSTATVWLDGLQMNLVGSPISKLPKFAGTQMVTGGLAYADSVDLATNQVTNKTADNISYTSGSTVEALQPAEAGADVTATHTAADTTNVNGVASTSISPIATLMPAEAGADVTATHTSADTSNVNAIPAATISQGAGRANAAIDSGNVVVASGIDLSRAYTNKTLTNIPDGTARFAVANGAGLGGVSYWDANNNPRIDFSGAYHLNKNQDWIVNGSTYGRSPLNLFNMDGNIPANVSTQGNLVFNGDMSIYTPPTGVMSTLASSIRANDGSLNTPNGWTRNFGNGGSESACTLGRYAQGTASWPSPSAFMLIAQAAAGQEFFAVSDAFPVRGSVLYNFSAAINAGAGSGFPSGASWYFRVLWYTGAAVSTSGGFASGSAQMISYTDLVSASTVSGVQSPSGQLAAPSTAAYCRIAFGAWGAPSTAWNLGVTNVLCQSTLDDGADGTTYSRFKGAFLDSTRRVATVAGAVSPLGSIVTGSVSSAFSYTGTSSSVTISWSAGTIYRMDGSTTAVSAGSVTVTGLSASTTYYAAAYFDEVAGTVNFVTGQSGAVGSPAILYPAEDAVVGWQAQLQSRLNLGWIPVATGASGGAGTGGNGTSGCCLRGRQIIELQSGVMRAAEELTTGDVLSCPDGATRITQLRIEPWDEWYTVGFNDGRVLEVAPDHRFVSPDGVQIHTRDLKLNDIVQARDCYLSVTRLELTTERDLKVGIEVQAPHTYYVDGVLAHNKVYC